MSSGAPPEIKKLRPLGKFQPELFDKMIQGLATDFRWSRALLCSCQLNGETGQPDPTCGTCGFNGFRYVHPRLYAEADTSVDWMKVKAVFADAKLEPNIFHEAGEFIHGDALLTAPGAIDVGYADRWVGIELEMPYSEVLERAAGNTVLVGHGGRTTDQRKTVLRYEPLCINFVGDQTTIWYPGTDFLLKEGTTTEKATLEWLPGQGPATGARYSIHYTCHPIWVVTNATYGIQNLHGPASGLKSKEVLQSLPTTFKVRLDYLAE